MGVKSGVHLPYQTSKKKLDLYDIFKDWDCEKLNIKFCKFVLGVNKRTTNMGVVSELGRFPLFTSLITALFLYWHRLENKPSNIMRCAYEECKNLHNNKIHSWYSTIQFITIKLKINLTLCKSWSEHKLKVFIKNSLRENFLQHWEECKAKGLDSGKLTLFYKLKDCFRRESYLDTLNFKQRSLITKFRISAHQLRIETGRYEKKKNKDGKMSQLVRDERICLHCNMSKIEDEFHFLLECPLYSSDRLKLVHSITAVCNNFSLLTDKDNFFFWILNNEDKNILVSRYNYINLVIAFW